MVSRSWCFTINNPTLEDQILLENATCRYLIYGHETGENGTHHLQGYIEFDKPIRLNKLKNTIMPRAHLEMRRGTRDQAREYCMKDEEFVEFGDWNAGGQGTRNDLHWVKQIALDGGLRNVTTVCNNLQQIKVAEQFLIYNEEPRDFKPNVIWIYGSTGTHKSHAASIWAGDDAYRKSNSSKWWNGYDGHTSIIIDDFRDSWWSLTEMLSITDRYAHRIECKGGERQLLARNIYITSAFAPQDCYRGCNEQIDQLLRRIDKIYNFATLKDAVTACPEIIDTLNETEINQLEPDLCSTYISEIDGVSKSYANEDNILEISDSEMQDILTSLGVSSIDDATPVVCNNVRNEVAGVILKPRDKKKKNRVAGGLKSPFSDNDIIYENIFKHKNILEKI